MKQNKYEALTEALREAVEAARPFGDTEDGGTCNFDSLALYLAHYNEAQTLEAIKAAGVRGFKSSLWRNKVYIIGVPCPRQGNARTRQAEKMRDVMRERGYAAGVHYQMD